MEIVFCILLCVLLYCIIPQRITLLAIFSTGLVMACGAYFLSEYHQYDLIYYRELYSTLQEGGIQSVFVYSAVERSPGFIWLVYFLTYFADNRLVSAIPTFFGVVTIGFITKKMTHKNGKKKFIGVLIMLIFFFLYPWHALPAAIRNPLAHIFCLIALYWDLETNKFRKALPLYIFAIFIHQSSIIFIFLRILLYLYTRGSLKKTIVLSICLFLGSFSEIIGPILDFFVELTGIHILDSVSHSFNSYTTKQDGLYEYGIVIVNVVAILLIYFSSRIYFRRQDKKDSSSMTFYTMLMLVTIGYIWQYDILCRFSNACVILSPLVLCRCNYMKLLPLVMFSTFNLVYYYLIYYSKFEIIFPF